MTTTPPPQNPPLRLLSAYYAACANEPRWLFALSLRGMWVAATLSTEPRHTVIAPDLAAQVVFDVRSARQKQTFFNRPLPSWSRYVAGVSIVLHDSGVVIPPLQAVIVGDEPIGPRYEHALGLAFAVLGYQAHGLPYTEEALLAVLERVRLLYLIS